MPDAKAEDKKEPGEAKPEPGAVPKEAPKDSPAPKDP
jgi:hypothetical protein